MEEKKMEAHGIHSNVSEAEYLVRQAQEKAMKVIILQQINYLKMAIEKYPRYAEAYTLLGNCQDCLDKNEDAIASYDKALQIDPGHAEAWFNKGMSLKKLGKNQRSNAVC